MFVHVNVVVVLVEAYDADALNAPKLLWFYYHNQYCELKCTKVALKFWNIGRGTTHFQWKWGIFIFPQIVRPSAALCQNVDTPLKQYECCADHYSLTRRCNIASAGQCFDNIFFI